MRVVVNGVRLFWFNRPGREGRPVDLLPALSRVRCTTLVLGGEEGPMTPIECQAEILALIRDFIAH